ncbi:unnamed protein product [Cuscuta europaea]|uniref:Retrotransposon Copia-like N-terminal domain-containing protein n=1 Tax=Cuscuta europaea TaxID=41803 RepID=A0A9P1E1Y9_CUSEU|nr:unnamed protein product [Cuscuta europaea]
MVSEHGSPTSPPLHTTTAVTSAATHIPLHHPSTHDTDSPYFIHPSDSTGAALVGYLLTGLDDYNAWSLAMIMALRGRNKFSFVDGSLPMPSHDDPNHDRWHRVNNLVMSWILHSIHVNLAHTVLYAPDAATVWSDLKARFSTSSGPQIYDLERQISTLNQNDDTIAVYHNKLQRLWSELTLADPPPKCTCAARTQYASQLDRRRLMQFLMGLRDTFAASRSQLLLTTVLPPVHQAYNLLLQDEAQRLQSQSYHTDTTSALLATPASQTGKTHIAHTNSISRNYSRPNSNRSRCTHCGIPGHTQQVCYRLHGYPPGHKYYKKGNTHGAPTVTTTNPAPSTSSDSIQQLLRLLREVNEPKANLAGPFDEGGDWSGP